MANDRTIVFFRVAMVQPPQRIGDICDIIDGTRSPGKAHESVGGLFTQVRVTDLSEELEEELREGIKKLRIPEVTDPFYTALLSGKIIVNEADLLTYVEAV